MAYKEQDEIAEFEHHAARAFFASAWADCVEENGAAVQGDIMAQMPTEIDPAALHAAHTLRLDMERVNGKTVGDMLGMIERDGDGDRDNTVEFFGHYAAMQAMGHGVGLGDAFGQDMREHIKVPYAEFGSHSLEKDYFLKEKIMTAFTYQRVTYNGVNGWFATCRINGVYEGKMFGKTQKAAREAFDCAN